jgi:hypothetical protein
VWHALCPWFANRRIDRKQIKPFLFYYYKSNHTKITVIFFITNQLLQVSGCNGPSTGSTQLYKTVALHFLHVADLPKTPQCVIYMYKTELCTENRNWSSLVVWVSQEFKHLGLLHIHYTLRSFQKLWYMQKMLSNCIIQLRALWWWTNKAWDM